MNVLNILKFNFPELISNKNKFRQNLQCKDNLKLIKEQLLKLFSSIRK